MKACLLVPLVFLLTGTRLCDADCEPADPNVRSACDYPGLSITSWSGVVMVNSSNCDLETDKNEFVDQPRLQFPAADPDVVYTVIMIDPDVPFFDDGEYWLHWVVSNIKGADLAIGNLDAATEIKCYNKPEPPEGSGAHRYQFLVFEQSISDVNLRVPMSRQRFRLDNWLQQKAQKKGLCGIVAGVQFRAPF